MGVGLIGVGLREHGSLASSDFDRELVDAIQVPFCDSSVFRQSFDSQCPQRRLTDTVSSKLAKHCGSCLMAADAQPLETRGRFRLDPRQRPC